jgi:hypothetical protein
MHTLKATPSNSTIMDMTLEKGLALRYLLGAIGDIHQPMRTITHVSKNYPDGDRGGELFPVDFTQKVRNLKLLWDSGMGRLMPYFRVSWVWRRRSPSVPETSKKSDSWPPSS